MSIEDGGPAFPCVSGTHGHGDVSVKWTPGGEAIFETLEHGISVRMYLAAKAMQGWMSSYAADTAADEIEEQQCDDAAKLAFRMADAMILESRRDAREEPRHNLLGGGGDEAE